MFIFKKDKTKRQQNVVLEKFCNKIVDVINETFTKKHYFVKVLQSKKATFTWLLEKRGRLFREKMCALHRKIHGVTKSVFI